MLHTNLGAYSAYQDTFISNFLKFYPVTLVLPKHTWGYIVQFWYFDLFPTDSIKQECTLFFVTDILPIRTISQLGTMAFRSVSWAYIYIKMDTGPPNTRQNISVRNQAENAAASVNIPVHRLNTAGTTLRRCGTVASKTS